MTKNENQNEKTINSIINDTEKKFLKKECKDIKKVWKKNCPKCGNEQQYSTLQDYNKSLKRNRLCKKCSHLGNVLSNETKRKLSTLKLGNKNPFFGKHHTKESKKLMGGSVKNYKGINGPFYGKHHTEETKKKLSKINRGKLVDKETNEKVSESVRLAWKNPVKRKNMLSSFKWNNRCLDKGQLELLEKWNKLGFKFVPNFKIRCGDFIYYLDGYDTIYNVIIEYDSAYHKKSNQKKKDLVRQNRIIETLNPRKFWRFDSVSKIIKNIL